MDENRVDSEPTELAEDIQAFCLHLRQAREQAGIEFKEACMATRITEEFLEALESGDFQKLPGMVFGRGFIRSLWRLYRLDDLDKTLQWFDRLGEALGLQEARLRPIVSQSDSPHTHVGAFPSFSNKNKWMKRINPAHYFRLSPVMGGRVVLVGGFLVLTGISLVYLWPQSAPVARKVPEPKLATLPPPPPEEPKPIPLPVSKEPAEVGLQQMVIFSESPREIKIRLDHGEWDVVQITAQKTAIEFKEIADLFLKNPEGIHIEYEGQPIGPFAKEDRNKRLSFSRLDPHASGELF